MKNTLLLNEYQECLLLVEYLEILKNKGKVVLYSHIPNETYTKSWSVKVKNMRLGVNKGMPDYCIVGKKKIMFLEMKRKTGGRVSIDQGAWLDALSDVGIEAYLCNGFDVAKQVLDEVL